MSSVVNFASTNAKQDVKKNQLQSQSTATVYSIDARKRATAFNTAKKNMKLAAQKLDW